MTAADLHLLQWLSHHRIAGGTSLALWVKALSRDKTAVVVLALACGSYVLVARRFRLAVTVLGAVVVSYGASELLKQVFRVHRPPPSLALLYVAGWSFPSTDSAITAAAATALVLGLTWLSATVRRRLIWLLAPVVAVVGFLLVYLGAHWPTDVVAGWALGVATAYAVAALLRRFVPPARTS